jgi:hypothetical protein
MASTYTATGIELITDGEQSNTWGQTTNTNFELFEEMVTGVVSIALSSTSYTLTTTDGATSNGRHAVIVFTGTPGGTCTVTVSPNDMQKVYFIVNNTDQTVTMSQGSGANVSVATGKTKVLYCDGAGSGAAVVDISNGFDATTLADLGVTASAAELNLLDGVTATTAELNILDGVTATAAELNLLDGVTASTAELNILDGVTASTAELNILDGVTATASELNQLDGVTLSNYADRTADAAWTGSQRATVVTDNDGSFDMNAGQNFSCTPTGSITLTFTNIANGQSGFILLANPTPQTVSLHANTKGDANLASTLSTAGTYLISYFSNGTNVYLTTSGAIS